MPEALYAPLPEPKWPGVREPQTRGLMFNADEMRAYADANCSLRGGQQGWQDIDSAPMDGSHILLYRPHITFVGFYAPNGKCWVHNAPGLPLINPGPTLWMPSPAHPAAPTSTHPLEQP